MNAPNTDFGLAFARHVSPEPNSGCWLWAGYSHNGRYGSLKWHGKRVVAHLFSYEWHVGPVPISKELDHTCRNTWCVNPQHLEPVTHAVNMARSKRATQTKCRYGHSYAAGVEIYSSDTHRYRRCLTCYRMRYPRTAK